MAPNRIALIHIPCKNTVEAKKIASALLRSKLIACANIFPINSMYRWKGKMKNRKEIVLITKTKGENYGKIQEIVKKLHSYSVPCIMKIDAVANKLYYNWLMNEMK